MKLFFKICVYTLLVLMYGCVSAPVSAPHPTAPQTHAPTMPVNPQTRQALAKCDALYKTKNNNYRTVQNCKRDVFASKSLDIREAQATARIDEAYRRLTIGELNATNRRALNTQRANAWTYDSYARGTQSWIRTIEAFQNLFK